MNDLVEIVTKAIEKEEGRGCVGYAAVQAAIAIVRNATLEEAAKVADNDAPNWHERTGNPCVRIASAIRALATHSGDGEGK